ncbi:hypothetical protein [Streptomyces sp. LaPpAH-108]
MYREATSIPGPALTRIYAGKPPPPSSRTSTEWARNDTLEDYSLRYAPKS